MLRFSEEFFNFEFWHILAAAGLRSMMKDVRLSCVRVLMYGLGTADADGAEANQVSARPWSHWLLHLVLNILPLVRTAYSIKDLTWFYFVLKYSLRTVEIQKERSMTTILDCLWSNFYNHRLIDFKNKKCLRTNFHAIAVNNYVSFQMIAE